MIVCSLISVSLFIYLGFSIKNANFEKLLIIGLPAAFLLVIGLSAAHFLRSGQPTSIYSLDKKQIYNLITKTETTDFLKFLYILEDSQRNVFCIASKEPCLMSACLLAYPVSVKIYAMKDGQYGLLPYNQPTAEIPVKTSV